MPPDLFDTDQPPARAAKPRVERPYPVRTGVEWRDSPWTPARGRHPLLSELLVSLRAARQRDDLGGLLWVLAVATSWLDRPAAERVAELIDGLLREQQTGRAA